MGNVQVYQTEMRIFVSPGKTHVFVKLEVPPEQVSDCPFMVPGWHYKAFDEPLTVIDIITYYMWQDAIEETQPMYWARLDPEDLVYERYF